MPRKTVIVAEMFLPSRGGARTPRARSIEDNPSLQMIWDVVGLIPRGRATTYGAVARAAGLPGRARLAGLALRVAGNEMNLPWHRVVGAGGRIVFPKSSTAHREQSRRLRSERVAVKAGRVGRAFMTELENI